MRWARDALGRDRIWYSIEEIESIMDDEARKAGLTPTADQPAVNLEGFLERHLGAALDQYATLPIDVLGQTVFEPGFRVRVEINADLSGAIDDGGALSDIGRWRATLAHEAAHILLHRVLFELPLSQGKLFDEEPVAAQTLMRCLKRDAAPGRGASDWREVQANSGMAALLMPRKLFSSIAAEERSAHELPSFPLVDASEAGDLLVRRLAARFDVSRQAARIRLRTLGLVADPSTLNLGLLPEV
ncbi:MAG: ImmA/IrrE family metallo-endopeptidase [Chloroflexi bacterium]|nr:ImmA/IrrE family metallo-endopeptidase [Chloroflexota bacterium]